MPHHERPKKRVAIIGGGCAAIATAMELSRPELRDEYEITVYQLGWRLGGKGASGRGPHGRIEEHGLHVWMGFYENAFRLMRQTYAELGRAADAPLRTVSEAFARSSHIGLANWDPTTDWTVWSSIFPELPGEPGELLDTSTSNPFTVSGYLVRMAAVMVRLFETAHGPPGAARPDDDLRALANDTLVEFALRLVRRACGAMDTLIGLTYQRVRVLAELLARVPGAGVIRGLGEAVLGGLDQLRPAARDPNRQRAAEVLELTLAAALGIIRDGLLTHADGFDAIDDLEFCAWLRTHGASQPAVNSPFMRGLYSLMFAYEDGDFTRPRVAAGAALRGCLRMFFTYRGAFFWKMRAGMGDVVFAPMYEVLERRGVRFEFFHRLTRVGLGDAAGDEAHRVTALHFDVQARVRGGAAYQPLVDVRGLPCWPSQPDWAQLEHGAAMQAEGRRFESFWDESVVAQRSLTVGRDFDFVVLGVSIGALPHVCRDFMDRDPRWRDMVANLATVATQALQLWTRESLPELGWTRGPITMTAFTSPFDTWSDMTHLNAVEDWPSASLPGSIAYFCNVLDERQVLAAGPRDAGHQDRIQSLVRHNAIAFVARDLPQLWPGIVDRGATRWDTFVGHDGAPSSPNPAHAMASQFVAGNVNPSDRYVQCLPGTPRFRISPLDTTYENLTITGDWTQCGLNVGCVEAAVMSGLLAAHAISQSPPLESIIGYDHP